MKEERAESLAGKRLADAEPGNEVFAHEVLAEERSPEGEAAPELPANGNLLASDTIPVPDSLLALAHCAESIAETGSRNEKIGRLAAYLRKLDDEALSQAVLLFSGSPFAATDSRKLSIGHMTMRYAMGNASGYDLETVATCYREVGDTGETAGLLVRHLGAQKNPCFAEVWGLYEELAATRRTETKLALLERALRSFHPLAVKYFLKGITGNLRIGLQEKMVEEALAQAGNLPAQAVRDANNRAGDLGRVALAVRAGTLEDIAATLFHPMDFMLAKPLDVWEELPEGEWLVEDKFDGIRAQAHVSGGKVRLFTRGLEEATGMFPEVLLQLAALPGPLILDGEVLAWNGAEGRALPFNALQQRLNRKKVTQKMMDAVPVIFLAYDLLMVRGELVLQWPVAERRAQLVALGLRHLAEQQQLPSAEAIGPRFQAARQRGNEGLILKRAGSLYDSGKRSGDWLKIKRPYATLDVVVTAAEQGHGRRATLLSDVTFAVREGERFLNIGKAYSGLTDEEIRQLTQLFKKATVERYGRVHLVRPEVVLEVAFDGVQKSSRHKSGFALRFPRILRWRQDKPVPECDTLERVRQLYEASLG